MNFTLVKTDVAVAIEGSELVDVYIRFSPEPHPIWLGFFEDAVNDANVAYPYVIRPKGIRATFPSIAEFKSKLSVIKTFLENKAATADTAFAAVSGQVATDDAAATTLEAQRLADLEDALDDLSIS